MATKGSTGSACGRDHIFDSEVITEKSAIKKIPACVRKFNAKKVFLLADINTYKAAGEAVCRILKSENIPYSEYIFAETALEPDEKAVGSAIMHYDSECDLIIGVGSGVINDIGKILSKTTGNPYIIVATAPSMDGYASASSSMSMDGVKVSLSTRCADCIIGDIDILKQAPERMLISGIGDMLAKYISICEWRISNLVTGEYYCEEIAALVREALKKCVMNADGLLSRDEKAVEAVFSGLVLGGVAMNYAGISRPASGVEHYFSHVWDMRGLEFGTKVDFHGIQCAAGTMYAAKIYEKLKNYIPDREKALKYVSDFDYERYKQKLRAFLGKGADTMILLEEKEQKYDRQKHRDRLDVIIKNWDRIIEIINNEVPSVSELEELYKTINMPVSASGLGIDEGIVSDTFEVTKDIRDKYVLSRLCWDLGVLNEAKEYLRCN